MNDRTYLHRWARRILRNGQHSGDTASEVTVSAEDQAGICLRGCATREDSTAPTDPSTGKFHSSTWNNKLGICPALAFGTSEVELSAAFGKADWHLSQAVLCSTKAFAWGQV